jgi:RHS repeat-associated protein
MYDGVPTTMTTAAICASRELAWSPSFYRGEQYDSDLGLYYLRARYYNPATGRFLSRDPENGQPTDPQSLHKYLYAGGDPTSAFDPSGRADIFETGKLLDRAARQTALVTFAVRTAVLDLFCFILSGIEQNANLGHLPDPVPPGPSFACWWSSGVATVTTIIALVAHALVAAAP